MMLRVGKYYAIQSAPQENYSPPSYPSSLKISFIALTLFSVTALFSGGILMYECKHLHEEDACYPFFHHSISNSTNSTLFNHSVELL